MREHVLCPLKPGFLVDNPCTGHVPGGQPAGLGTHTQFVGTLVTERSVDGVAALVGIVQRSEEGSRTGIGVADGEVLGVLLLHLLEHLVVEVGEHTHVILHTIALEPGSATVDGVDFHTSEHVHAVVFGIHIIIGCGSTEVVAVHVILGLTIETAIGQHADRERVGVIGVGIEPGVGISDGGVTHGAVGLGLVGRVVNLVHLRGGRELIGSDGREFHGSDGLVLQFGLELGVHNVEVHIVVFQLVEDVERSIVTGIELVGVKRS